MKHTGMIRRVDELGRIVMPVELRRLLQFSEGDPMEFFFDDETRRIMLRPFRSQACVFCGSTMGLVMYRERFICSSCVKEMKTPPVQPKKAAARPKTGNTLYELAVVMEQYPGASPAQWAEMIGVATREVEQIIAQFGGKEA
ncbi:AbrB/MazE/SpoVT family DNA-binding domain-containing protein [Paenibacillus sp. IB182496]|uniref:AbrB/MazE/SpoVT family DNA-binding domain-containing protein n=1 Tax=Paenibacillus sabuli TaxID=2772509 RepID=A0A927BPU9_9BACL|nr:AbrB/MazE/SpoVT family DNA-binding domain-containing protein [Paenibacillus sabuli]MBD2843741.1 AbrB/MazE/SpoVT family DNA-binding domain-containing protein [Paenibacillus sabuli]